MDIATVIGLVAALGFIGASIGSGLGAFLDAPSIMIVLGGTIAATMVAFPMEDLKQLGKVFSKAFLHKEEEPDKIIEEMIELANIARKDGLLALEDYGNNAEDEFMKKSIMLIVDGTDPDLVRNILETELTFLEERHSAGQGMLDAMGGFAPGFGMIGTLIGLVQLLGDLEDASTIGPNMSVALVTTFYGSFLENVLFAPLANKLRIKSKSELLIKELILEGLLSIQAGENPRIIEEKLKTFIPPDIRDKVNAGGGGE